MTIGSMIPKSITFQVAVVHKPLLSIAVCADMGFDSYFGEQGGHTLDSVSCKTIQLKRRNSIYIFKMWVRQDFTANLRQPFAGQRSRRCKAMSRGS